MSQEQTGEWKKDDEPISGNAVVTNLWETTQDDIRECKRLLQRLVDHFCPEPPNTE